MHNLPEIKATQTVATSKIFNIEAVDLHFSNGQERQYERLKARNKGAVLIVPMLDAETVLLIKEYAVGLERYELGFPKGLIEEQEDILVAANREIMEEVGYGSNNLHFLSKLSLAPGYMCHMTNVILAQDLYPKRLPGDEPEEIEVVPFNINNVEEILQQPNFSEARSIAALFLAKQFIASNQQK